MAGRRGAGQGGLLRSGALPRPAVGQRLHALHRVGRDHRGPPVSAPGLSLCPDLLELGDRNGLFFGEPGEPQRGVAERPVAARRRPSAASHGSADGGGAAGSGPGRVQATLPGAPGPLRPAGGGHQPRRGSRERRRGAKPPSVQAESRPGPAVAGQPRLCQPGCLRGVPAAVIRPGQRRSAGSFRRGIGPAAAAALPPSGGVQATAGAGGNGQHGPRGGERLLGSQSADRRVDRSAAVCRAGRGLVRSAAGGGIAAVARPGQAPHRLSARHRLAGPQARGVRQLSLPGRPVS